MAAADRLIDALRGKARVLIEHPQLGVRRETLFPELRALFHAHYGLYYIIADRSIDVLRVLHGARDAAAQFDEEDEYLK
jgi:toxin ParE1/3/4